MKKEINGNTDGIREIVLREMEELYDLTLMQDEFLSDELCDRMAYYTGLTNREVLVYVSRQGNIEDVRIGDDRSVGMQEMRTVRNIDRLAGVRCIHTHPGGNGLLSDVDIGSLNSLRLDAMAAIGVTEDGRAANVYVGYLGDMQGEKRQTILYGPMRPHRLPQKALMDEIFVADERFKAPAYAVTKDEPDRAILCGIENDDGYDTLAELKELAETAGIKVVGREMQRKRAADSATYIGSGKAEDMALLVSALEADIVIFDDELDAVQMRNLENILGVPIIDRTMLILDIFATRATTREGKLQVELAQLKYRLPRLTGMGRVLSRQGSSGVGMRGPGEKKLEIDRRRIRRRIYELEQELAEVEKQRGLRRARREKNAVPVVALVGYTNAGKSTLLNRLSGSGVLAEDKLFATLDPVVREIELPDGTACLLSDTVGFINKLPHDLVQAFRSTLEEVAVADVLLHVVDTTSPYYDIQMRVVEEVVASLGAANTPVLEVFNKIDSVPDAVTRPGGFRISAKTGEGLDELLAKIEKLLSGGLVDVEILIPYDKYTVMNEIRNLGKILSEEHEAEGTRVKVRIEEQMLGKIKKSLS
ncbi:MAG: GTPase HflX [Clostridia bacterium]|nr:GTPase HflX [Clostridia bacterium]